MNKLFFVLPPGIVKSPQQLNGILWNMASFGIIAGVGLGLNFVVAFFYDVAVLGIFNQVYAIYILLSQVAVGGVHLSVLKSVSQSHNEMDDVKKIFSSGFILTFLTSMLFAMLAFALSDYFGSALGSPEVSIGVACIAPGLMFFSLNKTMLALFNGLSKMKAYAIFQALRFIFMLFFLLLLVWLDAPGYYVPVLFSCAEGLLLFIMLVPARNYLDLRQCLSYRDLYHSHAVFGLKAAGGNILLDVTTRIDVIILGLFATDRVVGIYSFAALVVEGFSQLPTVIRTVVNPLITQNYFSQSREVFQKFLWKIRNLSYLALVPLGVLVCLGYPLLYMVFPNPDIVASQAPLYILMVGAILGGGYLPLLMIFNQTGYPASQTLLIFLIFLTNLILNILLVPPFGMIGSAVGTGLTFALQIVFMRWLTYRVIGIRV